MSIVNIYKKTAIAVGVLFIIALFFNLVGMSLYEPILNAPDFLTLAFQKKFTVLTGLLLDFISIPALVLIPIVVYPLLKKFNERLALGYVVFRAIEGALFIATIIGSLSLFGLSKEYVSSGIQDASLFQATGNAIYNVKHWISLIYIIIFTLAALIFYSVMYSSLLLPRFISIWGFMAVFSLLIGALLGIFDIMPLSTIMATFGPLVGLNELFFSIWLIVKGFHVTPVNTGIICKHQH